MDSIHLSNFNDSDVLSQNLTVNGTVAKALENLRFEYFLLTLMVSTLSVVGILGNVPVLIVYFRRTDQKASNTFIKVLAFVDLLVCCGVMPYTIVYEYHLVTSDFLCRFFELLRHFVVSASNITLIAIAGERYIAVCQIGTKINFKWINRGVVAILISSLVMAAPSVGVFAVVNVSDVAEIPCSFPHNNPQFCHFTYTVIGKIAVMAFQGFQMIAFFLIFIIIVILYTIVYVVLWKKTKIHKKLTSSQISGILPKINEEESLFSNKDGKQAVKHEVLNDDDASTSDRDANPCWAPSSTRPWNCDHSQPKFGSHGGPIFNDWSKTESKVTFQMKTQQRPSIIASIVGSTNHTSNSFTGSPGKDSGKRHRFSFCQTQKPKRKRGYHRRTARMLFLCTVIYFVTWLPFWLDIFQITNSLLLRYMFFVGHATNPIVYGIVNKNVRMSLKKLLLGLFGKCYTPRKEAEEAVNYCSTSGDTYQ